MRSKASFFNGTVYRKNLTRFAPLWILYLVVWLFILPLSAVGLRVLHRRSGSAWLGGFLASFVVLAFTISHMVVSM